MDRLMEGQMNGPLFTERTHASNWNWNSPSFAFYYKRRCIVRPLWPQISRSRRDLNLNVLPSSTFHTNTIIAEWLTRIQNNTFTKCRSSRSSGAKIQHTALCVCVCQQWMPVHPDPASLHTSLYSLINCRRIRSLCLVTLSFKTGYRLTQYKTLYNTNSCMFT